MGILELALVAIKGLSVVLNNPALGGGSSVKMQDASELLGTRRRQQCKDAGCFRAACTAGRTVDAR
jgi:hypothetical protein